MSGFKFYDLIKQILTHSKIMKDLLKTQYSYK